jgi:hypothetical protein
MPLAYEVRLKARTLQGISGLFLLPLLQMVFGYMDTRRQGSFSLTREEKFVFDIWTTVGLKT